MGQLPVRYTRQKFYSLVMERLTVYAGAGKKSLEDLLYMLETSAMVKLPAGMKEERPELYDLLEVLRQADYRDMEKAAFENCQGCVTLGSSRLNNSADDLLILMDLINDLYVLQLCKEEALMDGMEEQAVRQILSGVWDHFEAGRKEMLADEITEMLFKLEGIQESAFGSSSRAEIRNRRKIRLWSRSTFCYPAVPLSAWKSKRDRKNLRTVNGSRSRAKLFADGWMRR